MEAYKESKKLFGQAYESGYRKEEVFFWGWGEQIFIPDYLLKDVEVVGVEKLNMSELTEKDRGLSMGPRGQVYKDIAWNP